MAWGLELKGTSPKSTKDTPLQLEVGLSLGPLYFGTCGIIVIVKSCRMFSHPKP